MSTETATEDTVPIEPDDELLVAYLDGELSSRDRDELEERLLENESLRLKLQSLQTGWEMLDALPAPTTNERLVESTLELVVSDILKIVPDEKSRLGNRLRHPFLIASISLLIGGMGWLIGYQHRRSVERRQLVDLALAENLDAYLWGTDQTLMRTLQSDPSWLNMVTTAREMGELDPVTVKAVQSARVDQRFVVIDKLDDDDRATLETRWDELSQLDSATLGNVAETAAAVRAQPDADLLLKTMSQYAVWRSYLPGDMRDAIEQTDGAKRKLAIADAITFTLESVSRRSGGMLDEDTVIRIHHALNTFLDERLEKFPDLTSRIKRNEAAYGEGARLLAINKMLEEENPRGRRWFPTPPGYDVIERITMAELDSIIAILSEKALDDLNLLTNWSPYSGHDPRLLERTLRTWAEEVVRRKFESMRPKRSSLIDRYSQLSDAERDELDILPASEIKRRLFSRGMSSRGRPQRGP